MSKTGDWGIRRGVAISTATPAVSNPATPVDRDRTTPTPAAPKAPRVVFVVKIYEQPAASRFVQSAQIRQALERCIVEFGMHVGHKLTGQIFGPPEVMAHQERPLIAEYEFTPTAAS